MYPSLGTPVIGVILKSAEGRKKSALGSRLEANSGNKSQSCTGITLGLLINSSIFKTYFGSPRRRKTYLKCLKCHCKF